MLQSYLESTSEGWSLSVMPLVLFHNLVYNTLVLADGSIPGTANATDLAEGFHLSPQARAQADLKFTYVVTCQIYGKQKGEGKEEAKDIAMLMQRCACCHFYIIHFLYPEFITIRSYKPFFWF